MSKVTDRLDNKQIVELAKQRYEQNKTASKFPGNIISLPSQGKTYSESSPLRSGKIEMRHMTAFDEDILTNQTYLTEGVVFDKLLEALIISPNINPNDLVPGDKEWAIISARILGYGVDYPVNIKDKEAVIDLSKLKAVTFDENSDEAGYFTYTVPTTGDILTYKYLTAGEAQNISESSRISEFLKHTVQAVNGNTSQADIQEYLKFDLRALDSRKFRKHVTDTTPGLDYNTTATDAEGGVHDAVFRFDVKLFWF